MRLSTGFLIGQIQSLLRQVDGYRHQLNEAKNLLAINKIEYRLTYPSHHKDYHDFIPSSPDMVFKTIEIIKKNKIAKDDLIIDAGCGVSPLLLALRDEGYNNLCGLEYDERLVEFMKYFTSIIKTDLTEPNPETIGKYKKAKLVYLFMPIRTPELYEKAVELIWKHISSGCIVMDLYGPIDFLKKHKNCKQLEYHVYKKNII